MNEFVAKDAWASSPLSLTSAFLPKSSIQLHQKKFCSRTITINLPLHVCVPCFTCGIMVSRARRSLSPMVAISTPSMTILPPDFSRIRNNAKAKDDFPAPVRPTMPICRAFNKAIFVTEKMIIMIMTTITTKWTTPVQFRVSKIFYTADCISKALRETEVSLLYSIQTWK